MNVYFLTDKIGPNYLDNIEYYNHLCNGNFHHTVYNYWILKNNYREKDINFFLVEEVPKDIHETDIVIFHYESFKKIKFKKYITIQAIGDYPVVSESNYLITHNKRMENNNTFFIHFPLPASIKKITAQFPPKKFIGVGNKYSFDPEVVSGRFASDCLKHGIEVEFIHDRNYLNKDADIFFFLRDKNMHLQIDSTGNPVHPSSIWCPIYHPTHRNGNRIYQAWKMNIPCILNREASIENAVKTKYDVLFAETSRELFAKFMFIKSNKDFFKKMIQNCKDRENENSYNIIVSQYESMFYEIRKRNSLYINK